MHQGLVAIRSFLLVSTAVFLLLPTTAAQAQLVTNPVVAEFVPSVNQNAIGPNGQPLVASYKLRFYMIGAAAPFQSGSIGRPATQSDGKIRVTLASVFFGLPSPGIVYEARVAAIGPGGTSISDVSNSFVYSVPCTVTVATASVAMTAAAGTSSQTVTTGAGCAWTAGSNVAWLTVVSAARGSGPGTVTIAVTANAAASPRSGTLTIGDHTVLVTQSGTPCTVGVTPTAQAAGPAAASGTIAVTAGPGCGWTATSGAAWLTIASGATGNANGTVAYNIVANTIASSRVGTLSIGGRTVTVSQAAAPPPLPGAPASPSPATGAAAVSTAANLTWTASGATSYDVRLGTSTPPVTVAASNLTAAAYAPTLVAGTKYFWQVVGRNGAGTTAGPVWSLTTAAAATTGLPAPWTSQDIGTVGVVGSATYGNGVFTVGGGGLDIWGTADAFRYVSQPLVGDATVVARVTALQNTHGNAKAGVMMRGALTAAAAHVMINAAVDGGIEFISRSSAGSAATYLGGGTQPAPAWLKLARVGSTVTGSVSRDGQVWTVVGSTSVAGLAYTGLVVTSADPAVRNLSTFDAVTVTLPPVKQPPITLPALPGAPASPSPATGAAAVSTAVNLTWTATGATSYDVRLGTSTPPVTVAASNLTAAAYAPTLVTGTKYFWQVVGRNSAGTTAGPVWSLTTAGLPAPWTSQDIGTVGVVGSATYGNGIFTVGGGGLDIWGTADAFRYVSQPLVGDATVVARVTALQNTHGNAKAGVMMRGALTAAAAHVMINAAVDGGIEFISRSSAGSAATYLGGGTQPAPAWLKLARVGSTVTGSVSRDGQVWTVVGSTSVAGLAYTGLVVTSADPAVRNLSTFDAVTVSASTR